ncbi:hypothetical protein [Streptomyces sp. NPDC055210]
MTTQENLPFYLDNLASLLSQKVARGAPAEEVMVAYEHYMARSNLGLEVRDNFRRRVAVYLDRLSAAGMVCEVGASHWTLSDPAEVRPGSP